MTVAANAEGLSVSAWARRVLESAAGRPSVWTQADRDYLTATADQLRRAGNNLNQLVKALHKGLIRDTSELQSPINDLRDWVEAIRLVNVRLANGGAVQGFGRVKRTVASPSNASNVPTTEHSPEKASAARRKSRSAKVGEA